MDPASAVRSYRLAFDNPCSFENAHLQKSCTQFLKPEWKKERKMIVGKLTENNAEVYRLHTSGLLQKGNR